MGFARQEASGAGAIGPEHVLLGLLQLESGGAAQILADLGADRATLWH
ncbi:MAG: Clp protease N-terminal domain-containing protein, partial [Planctomycetota bacterium]